MNIVTTIVTALTEMVTGSATAIGEGVQNLLLNEEGTGINSTGIIIFSLLGVGFAVGLMSVIFNLVTRR